MFVKQYICIFTYTCTYVRLKFQNFICSYTDMNIIGWKTGSHWVSHGIEITIYGVGNFQSPLFDGCIYNHAVEAPVGIWSGMTYFWRISWICINNTPQHILATSLWMTETPFPMILGPSCIYSHPSDCPVALVTKQGFSYWMHDVLTLKANKQDQISDASWTSPSVFK